MHIILIKDFFKYTNMKKAYKKQILYHNIKKFSLIVKIDLKIFFFSKTLTLAN